MLPHLCKLPAEPLSMIHKWISLLDLRLSHIKSIYQYFKHFDDRKHDAKQQALKHKYKMKQS